MESTMMCPSKFPYGSIYSHLLGFSKPLGIKNMMRIDGFSTLIWMINLGNLIWLVVWLTSILDLSPFSWVSNHPK